ncbi:hypothetical protein [Acetobacter persici]|uniref:hypothetical protein n=1 Tax=Acetobacter persici TaxID=1076596 RepID=UPI0039E91E8F
MVDTLATLDPFTYKLAVHVQALETECIYLRQIVAALLRDAAPTVLAEVSAIIKATEEKEPTLITDGIDQEYARCHSSRVAADWMKILEICKTQKP